jgi:hypothetical protein
MRQAAPADRGHRQKEYASQERRQALERGSGYRRIDSMEGGGRDHLKEKARRVRAGLSSVLG